MSERRHLQVDTKSIFIFSGALSAIMIMAANDIIAGNMSVGNLVNIIYRHDIKYIYLSLS